MSPRAPIELVCFDLGGVLIRLRPSWADGCAAVGVPFPAELLLDERTRRGWDELIAAHQTGRMTGSTYAERLSRLLGGRVDPAQILAVHDAWLVGEYAGVGELIDRLHGIGLRTACLSNTNPEHWIRRAEFPAVMRLQHQFASHELGVRKPDRAAYRAVESALDVRGERILFFDDRPENIAAARDLGWRTAAIDPGEPTAAQIQAALEAHGAAL